MSKGTGSFNGAKNKARSRLQHYSTWLVLVVGALSCQLLLAACGDSPTTAPATTAASAVTTAAASSATTAASGAATTAASGATTTAAGAATSTGSGGPTAA